MGTLRKYSSVPVSFFDTWTGIGSFTLLVHHSDKLNFALRGALKKAMFIRGPGTSNRSTCTPPTLPQHLIPCFNIYLICFVPGRVA